MNNIRAYLRQWMLVLVLGAGTSSFAAIESVSVNGKSLDVVDQAFVIPIQYARFTFDVNAVIKITHSKPIVNYTISPKRRKLSAVTDGNNLTFTLEDWGYWSLNINDDLFMLFADPCDANTPHLDGSGVHNVVTHYGADPTGQQESTEAIQMAIDAASADGVAVTPSHGGRGTSGPSGNTVYIPDGVYSCQILFLRDNVTLYLAPRAELQGRNLTYQPPTGHKNGFLQIDDCSNVKVLGYGTINANQMVQLNGWSINALYSHGATNLLIDGPIIKNTYKWTSRIQSGRDIMLRHVKILSNRKQLGHLNTDGFSFDACRDCLIEDSFVYCGDDAFSVKANQANHNYDLAGDPKYASERLTFRDSVVFTNTRVANIGSETAAPYIRDITFENIDAVQTKMGCVIEVFERAQVSNITFKNIHVENKAPHLAHDSLVGFLLFYVAGQGEDYFYGPAMGRGHISNVEVRDVSCDFPWRSVLRGFAPGNTVENVSIINMHIQNGPITSFEEGGFEVSGPVTNVTFSVDPDKCGRADLSGDGDVGFEDLGILAENWLASNCTASDDCGGADLEPVDEPDGDINMKDLAIFTLHWLKTDCKFIESTFHIEKFYTKGG